ncbi:hypothetical protein ACQY1Q_05275 [Tenacibaculum sp. TC6]|uniref:hypothetical protein n=1 Tax=Tenacibaculum sp. TC6 TaxID=3423223 RepID=UPI003D35E322
MGTKCIKIKQLLALFIATIFTSCGVFKSSFPTNKANGSAGIIKVPTYLDKNGKTQETFMWSHYDATKRGSLMYLDKKGNIRVLAENPPDAAIQSITNITAKTKINDKVDAELALSASKSIAELGKRTAAVNMLRDALYRLNEMYYATKEARDENREIIKKAIENKNNDFLNKFMVTEDTAIQSIKEISMDELVALFTTIVNNAKEIAIKEAESDAMIKVNEVDKIRLDLLKEMYDKVKDTLTKKETIEYLKKISK